MTVYNWVDASTPEAQGVSSSDIYTFLEDVRKEGLELHSLHVIRNGKMIANGVAKPFTEDSFHRIFSAAKGIVAAAVLLAVQEGYLSMDDLIVPKLRSHMPEDLDPRWERLTLYHLLTMTTGHDKTTFFAMLKSDDWVRTFFETPPAYEPGTTFFYDIGAQYVMNFLILQETGMNVDEYLKPRLLDPLGIELKVNYGAQNIFNSSSIRLKPSSMAKLALFYLQEGEWQGKQLLDRELARDAGRFHVTNAVGPAGSLSGQGLTNGTAGYAFHMWRNTVGGFRLDGGKGQFGLVFPDANMAVGMMSNEQKAHRILELFIQDVYLKCRRDPLPDNEWEYSRLAQRLEHWNLTTAGLLPYVPNESASMYVVDSNRLGLQKVQFAFAPGSVRIETFYVDGRTATGVAEYNGSWTENKDFLFCEKDMDSTEDLDVNMDYDRHATLFNAGWLNPNELKLCMRSLGLLGEYSAIFHFIAEDKMEITLSPSLLAPVLPSTPDALMSPFPRTPMPLVLRGRRVNR